MRIWRFHLGSFIRRLFLATVVFSVITCWIIWSRVGGPSEPIRTIPSTITLSFSTRKCNFPPRTHFSRTPDSRSAMKAFLQDSLSRATKQKVLIVYKHTSIVFRWDITTILEANRIPYSVVWITPRTIFPALTDNNGPRYSVIVFESLKFYADLSVRNRRLVDSYTREYSVGLVLFTGQENLLAHNIRDLSISFRTGLKRLKNAELNPTSPLFTITRSGGIVEGELPLDRWVVFSSNHSTHEYVEIATEEFTSTNFQDLDKDDEPVETHISRTVTTVMLDKGDLDGIKRVYFGNGVRFWLHRMLFIDSLNFLSNGAFAKPLDRWFLVDVDDIFVGKAGTRMTKHDVQALLSVQNRIRSKVPGFQFNLGYSGYHFERARGNNAEDEGDKEIIKNADKFWWFSHMWTHRKPHQITNAEDLKKELENNLEFAQKHNIPVNTSYAVAPHHSGVYPIHEMLYDGWKKYYNLTVTSTEEYPHLHPHGLRRGFIYKGVKVLPRQTCGLYTKNLRLKDYPKGPRHLEDSIFGGDLFQIFLDNPINIFMTHLSNYGNDRLALHTFSNVVNYLQCWTNLKLRTEHPIVLADMYFKLYPKEQEPLWTNPCSDKRHLTIWAKGKTCNRLPSMLIIGPQKTGTTALYSYLTMHPEFISNKRSHTTFEEVQFFNGHNYLRGLDWYLSFFSDTGNSTNSLLFEKSANYFDTPKAALRASTLLPKAKIIVILIDPVKRAYSWYQHVKSHRVTAAVENSFYDVLTKSNSSNSREFYVLGQRCLVPGLYAQHLERWLTYFPPSQIYIVDGDRLKTNPADVMIEVQQFLGVTVFDYSSKLIYDNRKGFYCLITANGRKKCLGKGKGRHYPKIDQKSKDFLENYYSKPNIQLASLLHHINKPIPNWLKTKT